MNRIIIDASMFLGMHAEDEATRVACKAFFVGHLQRPVTMSLEQVGLCDAVVWTRDRATQDAYYPFMDNLHTDMPIDRQPYQVDDLRQGIDKACLNPLPPSDRLTVAMALRLDAVVYTVNPSLAARDDLPVTVPRSETSGSFPVHLEQLYRDSLVLRVSADEWEQPCSAASLSH